MTKDSKRAPSGAGRARKASTLVSFAAWRQQMRLTQEQAAEALGVSASMVKNWDAGKVRGRGTRIAPGLCERRVMWAMARGLELGEWPE